MIDNNATFKGNYYTVMVYYKSAQISFLLILILLYSCNPVRDNEIVFTPIGSPYHITEDLVIDSTMKMVILPGTQLIFHDSAEVQVFGSIHIKGSNEKPVVLKPLVKDSLWGGIKLFKPKDSCIFENVIVNNGLIWGQNADVRMKGYYFYNTYLLQKFDAIVRLFRGSIQVHDSYFESNQTGEGIILHNTEHKLVLVENSEFHGVCDAIEYMRSFNNGHIIGNKFYNVRTYLGDAIDLNGCVGVIIENNYFENIVDCGIEIGNDNYGPSENIYSGNNIFFNCKYGIGIKGGSDVLIMNNTFYYNSIAISSMHNDFISNYDPNRIKVVNCIFSQSKKHDLQQSENSIIRIEYSLSDKNILLGSTNLFAPPLFIDAGKGNFRLSKNSPGIEYGRLQSFRLIHKENKNIGALQSSKR